MVDFRSTGAVRTHLSRLQSGHPEQVVGGANHVGRQLRLLNPNEATPPEAANALHCAWCRWCALWPLFARGDFLGTRARISVQNGPKAWNGRLPITLLIKRLH